MGFVVSSKVSTGGGAGSGSVTTGLVWVVVWPDSSVEREKRIFS
jgi:hypothetical protein